MLLVLDNYDSFTYNLVQYLQVLTVDIEVHRNDALTVDEVINLNPDAIVISPGPCTPNEAGISIAVVQALGMKVPTLGVCLGHQAIGAAHGASIIRAPELMHGKTSPIAHDGQGLFGELPNPFDATRYHSLIVERDTLPDELEVTAETNSGLIMAMQHRTYPLYGVQFHPESILTTVGPQLLRNFLDLAKIECSE
ncbi:MAG TPA: anthranilate/aminodeoxychorismate synthase component II [Chloroflexi bacterium]|nr:anthranilate/aminodeoxychorismate synthase component II [Chloroflexota bacterium]|tara:strand:+ start:887 stop:1471 length:585 start_codon:yes stop_codon:yes gene_type:complete